MKPSEFWGKLGLTIVVIGVVAAFALGGAKGQAAATAALVIAGMATGLTWAVAIIFAIWDK